MNISLDSIASCKLFHNLDINLRPLLDTINTKPNVIRKSPLYTTVPTMLAKIHSLRQKMSQLSQLVNYYKIAL